MRLYTDKQIQEIVDAAVAKAVAPLLKRIEALEEENARLKKNSSNSSKPPSSDIVKPPKNKGKGSKGKRKDPKSGMEGSGKWVGRGLASVTWGYSLAQTLLLPLAVWHTGLLRWA